MKVFWNCCRTTRERYHSAITLCTTYFFALVVLLQDKIEDGKLRMQTLCNLIAKMLQLLVLRLVGVSTIQDFKSLKDEEKCLRQLLASNRTPNGSYYMHELATNDRL